MGELEILYYSNWDLKLLLELLSVNSGVIAAVAILAQLDSTLFNSLTPKVVASPTYSDGSISVKYQV